MVAIGATVGGLTGAALLIRKLRSNDRAEHDDDYDDDEEYDEEDDDEDEPRGYAEDDDEDDEDESYDEEDDDQDDEPQSRRSSSRSRRSRADDEDRDRGLASTLWDAVLEGVRSSQGSRHGKVVRSRGGDHGDEEDDDSERRPRGASKTERGMSATRAPRGNRRDDSAAMHLVRQAKEHLAELTGHEAESVSGVEPDGDGRTRVRLEVVELERIPRTTDVLASYELTLDGNGELLDCSRVSRYSRSSAEGVAT